MTAADWWSSSELVLHRQIVQLLERTRRPDVTFWHTPNGERRDPKTASKLKSMGVLPGVADLIIMDRGGFYAMEIKAVRGTATPEQTDFLKKFQAAGGHAVIVNSVEAAVGIFKLWNVVRIA
jgi:elongation factor P hydroxylase